MRDEDIEDVSRLLCASYGALTEREGLTPAQTRFLLEKRGSVDCVREESRREEYLLARERSEILGVVSVGGDTVTKLYVAPQLIGRGAGRRLFAAAEAAVRAGGHTTLRLGAFPSAVGFYKRMGLVVSGHRDVRGPLAGVRIVLMEKELASRSA